MHGGEPFVAHRWDLLTQKDVTRKVEPVLGGEPRQRDHQQEGAESETEAVSACALRERDTAPRRRGDGQSECQRDAERGHDVDPPRVQVVLVDDARKRGHGAQPDRRPDEQPRPAGDRRKGDRAEREREVEEDERASEPTREVAAPVDVVEHLGRQPSVGDERRRRLEPEEGPDRERLGRERYASAAASASATRSWSSASIAVKNGSASVRLERSSETGQRPSSKPYRSRM